MKVLGFDEELQAIKEKKCPLCKKYIGCNEFRDRLSIKEYYISGLCQKCQDDMFGFDIVAI